MALYQYPKADYTCFCFYFKATTDFYTSLRVDTILLYLLPGDIAIPYRYSIIVCMKGGFDMVVTHRRV